MLYLDAVQAFLKDLQKDLMISRGYVSPRTIHSYSHRLTELGRYVARKHRLLSGQPEGDQDLQAGLDALTLEAFTENLLKDYLIDHLTAGNGPTTLNTHLYCFRSFWRFAAKTYQVPDPTLDLKRSRAKGGHHHHLPDRHVEAFLEHLGKRDVAKDIRARDHLFFGIIARYGTRLGETLALDLDSVTVSKHSIDLKIVGKGNKTRLVPLPLYDEKGKIEAREPFVALLEHYLTKVRPKWKAAAGHEKALFLSQKGFRWSDDAARAVFKDAMAACDLAQHGYVVHSLRHSVASRLLNSGVGLPTVSKILGHASTQVTASIYAHSDESEVEKGMTKTY